MIEHAKVVVSFNLGCDARLAGLPLWANPYREINDQMADHWHRGWKDVDINWGRLANGREVLRLPAVA